MNLKANWGKANTIANIMTRMSDKIQLFFGKSYAVLYVTSYRNYCTD